MEDTATIKIGWAVVIRRKDGTEHFACSGDGESTPVWSKRNKTFAVGFKKSLRAYHFDARVVPVEYSAPRRLDLPTDH